MILAVFLARTALKKGKKCFKVLTIRSRLSYCRIIVNTSIEADLHRDSLTFIPDTEGKAMCPCRNTLEECSSIKLSSTGV